MKDWAIRALKTFVQAFLAVLIPEFVVLLRDGAPGGKTFWAAVAPVLTAALAAAISAVWNISLEITDLSSGKDTDRKDGQ